VEGWEPEIEPYEILQRDRFSVVFSWKGAAVFGLLLVLLVIAISLRGRKAIGNLFLLERAGPRITSEMARVGPITGQSFGTREGAHSVSGIHLKGQPFTNRPGEERRGETIAIKRSDAGEDAFQRRADALSQSLTVEEGVICRAVYKMRPLLVGECFAASVGTLCCFTETVGALSTTEVTHLWYFGESEKARVTLQVSSSNWSGYSSHRINPSELGPWHVQVVGPGGRLLQTLAFEITPERGDR
jgi:hypothetical protein